MLVFLSSSFFSSSSSFLHNGYFLLHVIENSKENMHYYIEQIVFFLLIILLSFIIVRSERGGKKPVRVYRVKLLMDRDQANAARLRTNRITLIQQLDTEELIPRLIQKEILSSDDDIPYIKQGFSKIDRARRLVDCLLNENIEHPYRPVNWFLVFRSILLENPTAYTNLVNILDQTVIRHSNKDIQVEDHHQITNIQFDRYRMNKISVEGSFHKVIDHLTYHSQVLNKGFISFVFDSLAS